MLDDLVVHSLVGAGVVYICVSPSINCCPRIRLWVCCAAVVCLAALELRRGSSHRNLFTDIGLPNTATRQQIHQAYRHLSKAYHPDKNPDVPDAEERFYDLKKAYDVLSHDVHRSNYKRFGDMHDQTKGGGEIDDKVVGVVVALSLVTQGLCYVIGYFCTFPQSFRLARQMILVFNLGVFCLELHMRFVEEDAYSDLPFIGPMLQFERIHLLRGLFPSVLCGCLMFSNYLFVDQQAVTCYLLKGVLSSNRVLCERMQALANTANINVQGPSVTSAAVKTKMAGLKVDGEAPPPPAEAASPLSSPRASKKKNKNSGVEETPAAADEMMNASDRFNKFKSTLSEEQKEQLTSLLGAPPRDGGGGGGSGVNWTQVLLWSGIAGYWLYTKYGGDYGEPEKG
eukprot:GHVS01081727.1.p1 GENE.GHVS01081727.1~~GHVS01081727.1.p1  ORF type:complete len:397 (+),score=76.20 GHVS01081727.1:124-1314(+)